MGVKSVYQSLLEVFPQVDVRILKAVAIDHSKDVDAAVEFILSEVISFEAIPSVSMSNGDNGPSGLAGAERAEYMSGIGFMKELMARKEGFEATSTEGECLVKQDVHDLLPYYEKREDSNFEYGETTTAPIIRSVTLDTDYANTTTEKELCLLQASTSGSTLAAEAGSTVCDESVSLDTCLSEEKILLAGIEPSQSAVKEEISSSEKLDSAIEFTVSDLNASQSDNLPLEDMYHSIVDSEGIQVGDGLDHGDVIRSSQIISSDFLGEFVTEAKTYKKSLASGMESLMSMAKEVEMQEAIANQAKEEASKAGIDSLAKVEEMKKMLQHAKAANEMHAGEVYGEKSILATEARELQFRLLNLSDQHDQSLLRIHEIRQELEARLAAAHEERIMAEKEKLEKEEIAGRAVAEQESIMAMVVQESKKLQEEAEENAKLQEFLIDRGRRVDQLQGEISVICEDIKLLQERVDAHLPIGGMLSSSTLSNSSSSTYALKMASTSHKSVETTNTLENSKTSSEALSESDASFESVESIPLQFNMIRLMTPDDEWEMFDEDFQQHVSVNVLSGHVISA